MLLETKGLDGAAHTNWQKGTIAWHYAQERYGTLRTSGSL